ncbi:MAG: class I SAM-dependent methyltransferase [Actinomyces sp.]|nr:MAG: class I SAM-dependent methyltransferase [Actinomyces sp.]
MDADAWNARYATRDFVWSVEPNVFVERHCRELEPGDAIDLAAGECRNAVWLAGRGWRVTAVDFSSVALDKGRRLAEQAGVEVTTVEADVRTWEPDGAVDLVVVAYLQLPTTERLAVLGRLPGWLRPGGTLVLVAHDRTNIEHGWGGPPDPDVCYELDETVAALTGLDVQVAEVAERSVATPDGERIALDTLVVAHRPT